MNDLIKSKYDFSKIPFDDITSLGQRSLIYRDIFNVSWLLGRFCNYACSYCWDHGRSDDKDHRPTELCISTMDEIKRQARDREYNSFHFSFSGGEPTLHPGYLEILNHYSKDVKNSNYQSVHMTTNLSAGIPWLTKYIEATKDLHRVSITASWHREFGDKEKFRDKLVFLQENDIQVTVNMVMVPEWFDMIWEEALFFQEPGINVTLKPQSNSNATKVVDTYTPEQLEKLYNGMPQRDYTKTRLDTLKKQSKRPVANIANMTVVGDDSSVPGIYQVELEDSKGDKYYIDQAERLNSFDYNKFSGWVCEAGYRSIIIREPCGSIKRSYSCHDEPLGNITTGFKLFEKPARCITPTCISSADSKIPKWDKEYGIIQKK